MLYVWYDVSRRDVHSFIYTLSIETRHTRPVHDLRGSINTGCFRTGQICAWGRSLHEAQTKSLQVHRQRSDQKAVVAFSLNKIQSKIVAWLTTGRRIPATVVRAASHSQANKRQAVSLKHV